MKKSAFCVALVAAIFLGSAPTYGQGQRECDQQGSPGLSRCSSAAESTAARQAEKRCRSAWNAAKAKEVKVDKARAANRRERTRTSNCTFFESAVEYLSAAERMLKLCEPVFKPKGPSKLAKAQELLRKSQYLQHKTCVEFKEITPAPDLSPDFDTLASF